MINLHSLIKLIIFNNVNLLYVFLNEQKPTIKKKKYKTREKMEFVELIVDIYVS